MPGSPLPAPPSHVLVCRLHVPGKQSAALVHPAPVDGAVQTPFSQTVPARQTVGSLAQLGGGAQMPSTHTSPATLQSELPVHSMQQPLMQKKPSCEQASAPCDASQDSVHAMHSPFSVHRSEERRVGKGWALEWRA